MSKNNPKNREVIFTNFINIMSFFSNTIYLLIVWLLIDTIERMNLEKRRNADDIMK